MRRPVLILRPEPGASATAARATAMGLEVAIAPLFEVRAFAWTPPLASRFDAVLMTSANAARLGGVGLSAYQGIRLFAVGHATAQAANDAGFTNIFSGEADAASVITAMAAAGVRRALHLAGRDRTGIADIPFTVETVEVYASETLPMPENMPRNAAVLLHSTRAALRYAEIVENKASLAIVAISDAVALAAGPGWQSIDIADRPQDAAMLALAASLCETQGK